jgi:hypothetical protein
MKRARLLRYARFQLNDYVIERGLLVLLLSVFNLLAPAISIRDIPRAHRFLTPVSPIAPEISIIFASLILVGVLFSSQEIVSRTRKLGYYRLLLAKPVSPVAFYTQLFIVHLLGFVLLISAVTAVFSLIALPLPLARITALAALAYVLLGGVGFLLSVFFNHDSIALIVVFAVSLLAKNYATEYAGIGPKLTNLLLPVDHVAALKPMLIGGPVDSADVLWVLIYGLTAVIAGIIALRYTQLAD